MMLMGRADDVTSCAA